MSTREQVQQLARPFVERSHDLALIGREIALLPVHHIARSIYIDRTSIKGMIQPFWRVSMLFGPPSSTTGWGDRLPVDGQYIGGSDARDIFEREADRCLNEILRPISTIEALRVLPSRDYGIRVLTELQECLISLAAGRFDQVAELLSTFIPGQRESLRRERQFVDANFRHGKRPWTWMMSPVVAGEERLVHLEQLLHVVGTGNPQAIADLLQGWEHHNAMEDRLHDVWKPTRFPFEVA
jgi:hypothetical protein